MFGLYKDPFAEAGSDIFEPPTMADTYRGILREHSIGKINRVIENCTFQDSSSVYERFFLDSQEEIIIVARGIKRQIFDRDGVLGAVNAFFARENTKLRLHLPAETQDDVDGIQSTEFYRVATDAASGTDKFELSLYKTSSDGFIPALPSVSFGDSRMYRKRVIQKNGNYSSAANADVNFFDESMVAALKSRVLGVLSNIDRLES